MAFAAVWAKQAAEEYQRLSSAAQASLRARLRDRKKKASKAEGLFKQVHECVQKLATNPRHPGLHTHKFDSLEHPYDPKLPVFEAYAQNRTPGAYRVLWSYGPNRNQITIIAITPHP